jgi:hypothetical protein
MRIYFGLNATAQKHNPCKTPEQSHASDNPKVERQKWGRVYRKILPQTRKSSTEIRGVFRGQSETPPFRGKAKPKPDPRSVSKELEGAVLPKAPTCVPIWDKKGVGADACTTSEVLETKSGVNGDNDGGTSYRCTEGYHSQPDSLGADRGR